MKIKESPGARVFNICNILLMLLVVFITLYPFYHIAIVSISDASEVIQGNVHFWPIGINFATYQYVLSDSNIYTAYGNTLLYTISGTAVNVLMTALCAYPLSRKRMVFRGFFNGMIIFTMFFSGGMIPNYLLVTKLGLKNTLWAIILPGAISTYNMVIMRTFFQGIPEELHESASIDGANDLTTLIRIILPLSLPVVATLTLFYAVGHWNSFFGPLIYLDDKSKFPLQIFLRNIVVSGQMGEMTGQSGAGVEFAMNDTTIKYAVIMVATLPILLVYPFIQKYFVKGVMVGSLKG